MARLRYARFISFASVVASSPRSRKGSSIVGRGGGFGFLLGEGEDARSAVLEWDGHNCGFNNDVVGRVEKRDGCRIIDGGLNASGVIVENAEHMRPVGTFILSDEVANTNMDKRRRSMM